ncbi:MAG: TIGR00300 family protein [Actinobacteria bacterium]|nr:TIGR00300 family protein [Actinomycetota bacterium]
MSGHLIDSGQLQLVLDTIIEHGADYEIADFDVGKRHDDESRVVLSVTAATAEKLADILASIGDFGAAPLVDTDAKVARADLDGCFPTGFYSTTNLPTQVRVAGRWVDVARPEMDCGIVLREVDGTVTARTRPVGDVRVGDRLVVGYQGVRVRPDRSIPSPGQPRGVGETFGFMTSDVSSEKPQGLLVQGVADGMRACRDANKEVLWVAGPALVHTGSIAPMVALIRAGYVNVVFAGNALPTHDIESAMYGTSLGVSQALGVPTEHGHSHHIRAVNAVRRAGSIAAAVEDGVVTSGIMHACVKHGVDVVLAASPRDDGPLPDVILDMMVAQARMRERLWDAEDRPRVGFCLVVATMLHGIATGNMLPAEVPLVCVDINLATVTKLADRGSAQATGVVTDVGLFVKELAEELAPTELAEELQRSREVAQMHAATYREGRPD